MRMKSKGGRRSPTATSPAGKHASPMRAYRPKSSPLGPATSSAQSEEETDSHAKHGRAARLRYCDELARRQHLRRIGARSESGRIDKLHQSELIGSQAGTVISEEELIRSPAARQSIPIEDGK